MAAVVRNVAGGQQSSRVGSKAGPEQDTSILPPSLTSQAQQPKE